MNVSPLTLRLPLGLLLAAALALPASAGELTEPDDTPPEAEDGQPELPYVEINREDRYLDLEAEICLTAGMLELAVTVFAGKEHESVAAVKARPQHVHLGLLMLGLESGRPGRWEYDDGEPKPVPPKGDPVRVSLVIEDEDGEKVEHPISRFIRQAGTENELPGDVFLFAGSHIHDPPDHDPYYVADMTGELVSLVSFDGEVLAWPRPASHANEELVWTVNEEVVPELGTEVTVRLRAVDDWEGPEELPDHTEIDPPETDTPAPGEDEDAEGIPQANV